MKHHTIRRSKARRLPPGFHVVQPPSPDYSSDALIGLARQYRAALQCGNTAYAAILVHHMVAEQALEQHGLHVSDLPAGWLNT